MPRSPTSQNRDCNGQPRWGRSAYRDSGLVPWVPGVNNFGTYGRCAFAEFTDVFQMQIDFAKKVESEFNKMIEAATRAQIKEALT